MLTLTLKCIFAFKAVLLPACCYQHKAGATLQHVIIIGTIFNENIIHVTYYNEMYQSWDCFSADF